LAAARGLVAEGLEVRGLGADGLEADFMAAGLRCALGAVARAGFFTAACSLALRPALPARAAARCGGLRPVGLVDLAMNDARALFQWAQSTTDLALQPCLQVAL